MGVYRAAIVTESGQNLIAQALANEKPLIFTSAKTSSYSYPVGTNVPALTGLQDVVQSVMPFDSKVLGGNVAQVSVRFDNDGVDQTYRIETIGLYAKIEGGTETLFSVTQATTPDEMPVQSDVSPSAYIYNIQHTVQNASQITLTVNPAGTATVQDIMDIESPEFDDSGTVEGISSFPTFLETMKSKMNFFQFFRNLKAGLQFVLHAGQIVNNCVTDNSSLPLSAAQGKVLKDLYTQLYSEVKMNYWSLAGNATNIPDNSDLNTYITPGNYCLSSTASVKTLSNCPVDNAFVLKISKPIIGNYILQEYIDLVGHQAIRVYNPYDKMWTERKIVLKDDLGVFLTASGTKAAVYKSQTEITNLKLYAGHVYLVMGMAQADANVSLISARITGFSSTYGTFFNLSESRTTGSNGGGCMTAAIASLTKDCTISLQGYGYDNATYNYIGNLLAIQLK